MKISDFLSPTAVLTDVRATQKAPLLQDLSRKAAAILDLPADRIASKLVEREQLGSTGTGGGIAIPHARIQGLAKPFGLLAKLRQPIDFDAIDGEPVDLVFMLLLPTTAEADHLGVLACIARRLRASDILVQSRRAASAAELYSAIAG